MMMRCWMLRGDLDIFFSLRYIGVDCVRYGGGWFG